MFSEPRLNVIECDEGFSVEVLGRVGLMYTEGEHRLRVGSDLLNGPAGLAIYAYSITAWEPPFQWDKIDASKKERIVENIRRAFRHVGYEIHVW